MSFLQHTIVLTQRTFPELDFTTAFHYFDAGAPDDIIAGGYCHDKRMLGKLKVALNDYFALKHDGPVSITISDFGCGTASALGAIGHAVFQAMRQLHTLDEGIADRVGFCLLVRRRAIIVLGLPLNGARQNLYIPSPLASGHERLADPDALEAEFDGRLRLLRERTKDGKTA